MLGKILLTLAVIVTAFFYIRQQDMKDSDKARKTVDSAPATAKSNGVAKPKAKDTLSSDLRFGAYMFLVLMIGLGGALYYFGWKDDHTVLTVTLHNDGQAMSTNYEVYKYQLGERSFTTLDGVLVTVASTDRMEVIGLEQ